MGHKGKFGHEFLEFELLSNGKLRYVNNSQYKNDKIIRKEMYVSDEVVNEFKRIIMDAEILKYYFIFLIILFTREDDNLWPKSDKMGKQELEIVLGNDHIAFETSKLGSLVEVDSSKDPEGLKLFYFLLQDLKCLVFSLIGLHFKVFYILFSLLYLRLNLFKYKNYVFIINVIKY